MAMLLEAYKFIQSDDDELVYMTTCAMSWENTTVTMAPTAAAWDLPVFGYPGSTFYVIHILAIACLSISILTSSGVLLYLFLRPSSHKAAFFKRPAGERLVVYLALCDLFFSTAHELDHIYMLVTTDHPPDVACIVFAFFVQAFILAQALLVFITAFNTMLLVVFNVKIGLGRHDWRLFALTLGIPTVVGIAGAAVPFIGQSGMW